MTIRQTQYGDARTIGEHFRDGDIVTLDLSEVNDEDGIRLVDFTAGLVFGLRGNFSRLGNRVYLLTPANIDVVSKPESGSAANAIVDDTATKEWYFKVS